MALNMNKVLHATENMIIMQLVFSDNFNDKGSLADKFRSEGTLYGDQKRFYATDILKSYEFKLPSNEEGSTGMDYNLLSIHLPKDPTLQIVTIDKGRQIPLTIDNKFMKQAFMNEGVYGDFVSVMHQQLTDTKKVYEAGLVNVFVGGHKAVGTNQTKTITLTAETGDMVEKMSIIQNNALTIGNEIADLFVELEDNERKYNDYGNMRSYDKSDFLIIWNSKYLNKIQNIALPTVFHNNGLIQDGIKPLPPKYFADKLVTVTQGDITSCIALVEMDYTVAGKKVHAMPGEILETGTYTSAELTALGGKVAKTDSTIICKIIHKNAIEYMSAFETVTEFWNPQTQRFNTYLTWGYGEPTQLKNYPFITIKASA